VALERLRAAPAAFNVLTNCTAPFGTFIAQVHVLRPKTV